jgi:hypothetical protein
MPVIPGVARSDPRCKVCQIPKLAIPLTRDLLLKRKDWDGILEHYGPLYRKHGIALYRPNLASHKYHCVSSQQFALTHMESPVPGRKVSYLELPKDLAEVLEMDKLEERIKLISEFSGLEVLCRHQFSHMDLLWKQIQSMQGKDGGPTASLHKALVSCQAELRTTLVEKFKMRTPEESESVVLPILIQEVVRVIFAEVPNPRVQRRIAASIERAHEYALKQARKMERDQAPLVLDAEFTDVPVDGMEESDASRS